MGAIKKGLKRLAGKAATNVKATILGDQEALVLKQWQGYLSDAQKAMQPDLELMDWREELYGGTREIKPGANNKRGVVTKQATTVRNFVSELIESQIDSTIPPPRVDPLYPEDEELAIRIEQMLLSDINRLPVEELNDEQERTVPIQGAGWFYVSWNNLFRTHTTVGDTDLEVLHPKQVFLQPGARNPRKSARVILQLSTPADYIRRRFGVDVTGESEENPAAGVARSSTQASNTDNVTLNLGFYFNDDGGVGAFFWVNDTIVLNEEDFFARKMTVCRDCGREKGEADVCECGGKKFESKTRDIEVLSAPITLRDGTVLPEGTKVPYYRFRELPVVLRKNVSVFGKLWGESDVDRIADLQERSKKAETKIDEKLFLGGSAITLPNNVSIEQNSKEFKVIRVRTVQDAQMVGVHNLQPNTSFDRAEADAAYIAAKHQLGLSDSFLGQPDQTATSGIAKQLAAAQSAGRLESKRRMKAVAWAEVYRLMFLLKLAFADEPRGYMTKDFYGRKVYGKFSRYDFLKVDAAGAYYYEDQFLFSTDDATGLANNRQALWQEARANYQQGAFGEVGTPESLVLYWSFLEQQHYPAAAQMKKIAQELLADQQALAEKVARAQMMQAKAEAALGKAVQEASAPPVRTPSGAGPQGGREGAAANSAPVAQQARTPGV